MELRLEIFAEGRRRAVTLEDLSRTGMFVRMDPPLPVGTRVLITLSSEGRRVVTDGHVTHALQASEARILGRSAGIGIELREPASATDDLFALAVERLIRAWRADEPPAKAHVVVAHGDPDQLEKLARTFRDGGFTVATATTGIQAVTACMRECPDAIVVERGLPVFDGLAVLAELAGDPRLAAIPSIVTCDDPTQMPATFEHGATDVVVEPFIALEVVVRTRRALLAREPAVVASGSLHAGFSLPALLSLMEHERSTGRLVIDGERSGFIDIAHGRIVGADGELAPSVMALLDVALGTFELHALPLVDVTAGALSITHVLLEHARLRDESASEDAACSPDEAFREWDEMVGLQLLPRGARLPSLHDLELGDDPADAEHADDPRQRATGS